MVGPALGLDAQREAAGIWARATAERDHLPSVPPIAEELAGIQHALAAAGASLHLARRGPSTAGFCILVLREGFLEVRGSAGRGSVASCATSVDPAWCWFGSGRWGVGAS